MKDLAESCGEHGGTSPFFIHCICRLSKVNLSCRELTCRLVVFILKVLINEPLLLSFDRRSLLARCFVEHCVRLTLSP